jgi:hypothetical protein
VQSDRALNGVDAALSDDFEPRLVIRLHVRARYTRAPVNINLHESCRRDKAVQRAV